MKTIFIETLGDGGIAHYTYNLISTLKEKKCNVVLLTTYRYEMADRISKKITAYYLFYRCAFCLIKVVPILSKETLILTFFRRILKIIEYPFNICHCLIIAKNEKAELIHFQTLHLIDLIMAIAFKICGYKTVYTVHNVMPLHKKLNKLQRKLYVYFYRLIDAFIIHSKTSKDDFVDIYQVNPSNIFVIPHGDYQFFIPEVPISKEDAKKRLGINSERKTILFFGAVRKNKGLQDIISALPEIRNSIPEVLLMIVGEPLQNYRGYRDQIDSLRLKEYVFEMLEYVQNSMVPLYFYASDLVVLPYHEISHSGVLQLAYAFGKPVIASDLGGFREAVENGKNGFLVPFQQPDILAKKINELLCYPKKIEEMGRHSLFLSNTKYSWDSIAEITLTLYKDLIDYNCS